MYQSVDDPEDLENTLKAERAQKRRGLLIWLAIGVSLLVFIAVFSGNRNVSIPDSQAASLAERASYRTALSESDVDLRRARLRDFETTYPESQHLPAVRAQLNVLNAHEEKAWAVLNEAMFEPSHDRAAKLAAVQLYEQQWGASYLGGRDADLRAIREKLETETAPLPSRELTGVKSPIPENIPDRVMVGGPKAAPPPRPVKPYVAPPKIVRAQDKVIPPRIRKNVTPRYPRRAQRRGVNALVELSLSIDADGEVQMAEVIRVDAQKYAKSFVKAAERAAMRTRYSPQTVNGKAVPTQGVKKRYIFRVDG